MGEYRGAASGIRLTRPDADSLPSRDREGRRKPTLSPCRTLARTLSGDRLLEQVAGTRRVDVHAGTHGRGEGDRTQVAPLGGRRLGADQLLDHGRVVLEQRALLEVTLADH